MPKKIFKDFRCNVSGRWSIVSLCGRKGRKEWMEHHLVTLYPAVEMPGHQWGMVIDLNSCVGCGACVVACNVENNVPVVGKTEVFRSHDMHWLRIDKYHTGDINNPDVFKSRRHTNPLIPIYEIYKEWK
jgi:ferredoxin